MKRNSRILAVLMALALLVSLGSITAFAADEDNGFTITISNALEGETYKAYKLMDATYLGTEVVTSETPIAYYYAGAATDPLFVILAKYFQFDDPVDGKYYVKVVDAAGNAIDYSNVDAAAMAAEINAGMLEGTLTLQEAGHVKATGENATITNLEKGYYFVNTTLGSLCALDTVSDVTINEKNTTTTQDKTVQEDSTGAWGDKNDASIGDTVHFKTTIIIGKYQKNVAFHDIMQTDKLALVTDTITVTGTGVEGHYHIYTHAAGTLPSVGTYANDTFAVAFDNAWTSALTADTTVTIEYDAVLTANAVIGEDNSAMGKGNDNQSRVTYGDAQETTWDWTRTYTWSFDILKYTGENKTPLADAEFQLKQGEEVLTFTLVSEGAAAQEASEGAEATDATATIYRYDPDGSVTTLVSPVTGLIQVVGLDADTYTLTETKAPEGYNRLTADVEVVIDSNTDTDQGTDGSGQPTGKATLMQNEVEVDQVEIENNSGTELPSTGGIGTTIFYIVGSILVVVAGVLLVVKKRMGADK